MKVIKNYFQRLFKSMVINSIHDSPLWREIVKFNRIGDELKILSAREIIRSIEKDGIYNSIREAEFKVFSQFGDDGIIQYLIKNISIDNEKFVEFGVQNYTESNTRFLLINNNWSGLVIDGDKESVDFLKQDEIYWRHELTAVAQFVTRENINYIISESGFNGELGLLSIDLDGNDYWIWEAITAIDPVIVIVEYNSVFGSKYAITIPYDENFQRTEAHYSNLYWGCSLKALYLLAKRKGYCFIGCNSNGNNAYFIRKDKIGKIKKKNVDNGYVVSKFRESRDQGGKLTYKTGNERLKEIEEMIVFDIESDKHIKFKELFKI
jgi:hypothetical protein